MMAVTQERFEMQTAQQLKQEGWIHDITDLSVTECQDRANWCREAFGSMFDDIT